MGDIQLAEELREHVGEVLIISDIGEELLVVVGQLGPVGTIDIGDVLVEDPLTLLAAYVVVLEAALVSGTELHASVVGDRLYLLARERHLLHIP